MKHFFRSVYDLETLPNKDALDDLGYRYLTDDRDVEADLQTFVAHMTKADRPPKTIRVFLVSAKMFLLESDVKLSQRFWRRLRRRIQGSRARTIDRVPSNKELRDIMKHLDIHCQALFLLLASSGMRIGKALQLIPEDIDLTRQPAKVTIRGQHTKSGNPRITFARAYIFPKKTSLAIGCSCEAKNRKHVNEILKQYLRKHTYRATKRALALYLPYSGIADKTFSERTMLIGDAAGFCNPIQGGGIYTAIRSAEFAATTINTVFQEEQTITYYEQLWKKDIGRDISNRVLGLRDRLYRHKEKVMEIVSKDRWCNSFLGQIMVEQISPRDIFSSKYLAKLITRPQLLQILAR